MDPVRLVDSSETPPRLRRLLSRAHDDHLSAAEARHLAVAATALRLGTSH